MNEDGNNGVFRIERRYKHMFKDTLRPKRVTDEIIRSHFRLIRTQAKNALNRKDCRALADFTDYSYTHFSDLIPRQEEDGRKETLRSEFEKTLKEISEKSENLRKTSKERGIHVKGEVPPGFGGGVGIGSKETKTPSE